MDIQKILIIIFFGGIIIGGFSLLHYLFQHYTSKNRKFITEINNDLKASTIKSYYFQEYRLELLQNLYYMKKYFGWVIIIIVCAIVGLSSYIVYDSRTYFSELFEAKRVKLNLAKETQVDSILNVIGNKNKEIDSLIHTIHSNKEVIDILENQNKELLKNQKTLNYFIEELKKSKETL